jgi:hypothetical protein
MARLTTTATRTYGWVRTEPFAGPLRATILPRMGEAPVHRSQTSEASEITIRLEGKVCTGNRSLPIPTRIAPRYQRLRELIPVGNLFSLLGDRRRASQRATGEGQGSPSVARTLGAEGSGQDFVEKRARSRGGSGPYSARAWCAARAPGEHLHHSTRSHLSLGPERGSSPGAGVRQKATAGSPLAIAYGQNS